MGSSYLAVLMTLVSLGASHPENTWCDACTMVAKVGLSKGCEAAVASALSCGGAAPICAIIFGEACSTLVDKMNDGKTPEEACEGLGYCGNNCECGVCTPDIADPDTGRCLGIPSSCGNLRSSSQTSKLATAETKSSVQHEAHANMTSGICWGGKCDGSQDNYGCCLTCLSSSSKKITV